MKQQSRISILRSSIRKWLEIPKVSRKVIAVEVVERINSLGFKETLADMAISFANTDDHYHDARVNAQKLFRWLGESDEGIYENADSLWHIEQAVVAAMPEDIRVGYLNSIWSITGSHITKSCKSENSPSEIHFPSLLINVIKECSEGQIALAELPNATSINELKSHQTEIAESIAAFQYAHEVITSMLSSRSEVA
tara:strand:- start:29876 stop:30463 length:588 start_codon:yes stop_codon:yes gene_type:complete